MRRVLLLTAAALLASCEGSTTPSARALGPEISAAVVRNDRDDRATYVINDCNGEYIAVDARFHYVTAVTFDAAGGYHVVIHRNVEFSGVSYATGAEYVGHQVDSQSYTVSSGSEFTSVTNFTLIGKGDVPNEVAQLTTHFTVTPDGQVTADHSEIRFDCQE